MASYFELKSGAFSGEHRSEDEVNATSFSVHNF